MLPGGCGLSNTGIWVKPGPCFQLPADRIDSKLLLATLVGQCLQKLMSSKQPESLFCILCAHYTGTVQHWEGVFNTTGFCTCSQFQLPTFVSRWHWIDKLCLCPGTNHLLAIVQVVNVNPTKRTTSSSREFASNCPAKQLLKSLEKRLRARSAVWRLFTAWTVSSHPQSKITFNTFHVLSLDIQYCYNQTQQKE